MRTRFARYSTYLLLWPFALATVACQAKQDAADTSAAFVETEETINPNETQRTTRDLVILRDAAREYEKEFGRPIATLRDLEKIDGRWLSYRSYDYWNRDGWGREFRLATDGGRVTIYSAGPDGVYGSADDIR